MGKTNQEPQKSNIDPSTSLQPEKSESLIQLTVKVALRMHHVVGIFRL
jgi:hypothetical protein